MKDLSVCIKKEWMEAVRTKKLMVLMIVALFFALFDPIMLKLTPMILKEFSGMDMTGLIEMSQLFELQDFNQDIMLIFTIVLVITISTLWSKEVKNGSMIMPLTKGIKIPTMFIAKTLVYGNSVFVIILSSYGLNYYYAGILFGFDVNYTQVLYSSALIGFYYIWFIIFVLMCNTIVDLGPLVSFIGIGLAIGGPFITSLFEVSEFTPFGLLAEASSFTRIPNSEILITLVLVGITIGITMFLGGRIATKKEFTTYS